MLLNLLYGKSRKCKGCEFTYPPAHTHTIVVGVNKIEHETSLLY